MKGVEIIHKSRIGKSQKYTKKTIVGYIKMDTDKGSYRYYSMCFRVTRNHYFDIREFYNHVLKWFENKEDYDIGYKKSSRSV